MTLSIRKVLAGVFVGGAALTAAAVGFGGGAQAATQGKIGSVVFDTTNFSPNGDWGQAYRLCKQQYPRTVSVKLTSLGYRTQDTQAYWDQRWDCSSSTRP